MFVAPGILLGNGLNPVSVADRAVMAKAGDRPHRASHRPRGHRRKAVKLDKLSRESLAPYLPIPGALVALVLVLAVLAIDVFLAAIICHEIWFSGTMMSLTELVRVVLGAAIVTAINVVMIKIGGNPATWLKAFVDRNVRGYELWCVRNLYGDPTVTYEIHRRGADELWPNRTQAVIIAVPLRKGARCRIAIPDHEGCWWTMFTHALEPGDYAGAMFVEMCERTGNRFTIGVELALRILVGERSTHENDRLTYASGAGSIGCLIDGLVARLEIARDNLASERTDRDLAVAELDEARGRIDATKRFVRSTEAMHIRDWLAQRVIAHAAFRDFPRRKREDAA